MTAPCHVLRYVEFFETLHPGGLRRIDEVFAPDARFVDPFNDVRGVDAIHQVFIHMFASCEDPKFTVDEVIGQDTTFYLKWVFRFGVETRSVIGVSRVLFDGEGRATEHVDYWDVAGQLYERVPVLGWFMKAVRRRLSAV